MLFYHIFSMHHIILLLGTYNLISKILTSKYLEKLEFHYNVFDLVSFCTRRKQVAFSQ